MVREDVMLVKAEPRLSSPCTTGSVSMVNNNLLTTSNLVVANSSNLPHNQANGLVVTTLQASGLVNNSGVLTNGLQQGVAVTVASLQQSNNNGTNGLNGSVNYGSGLLQSVGSGSVSGSSNGAKRPRPDDWLSSPSPGGNGIAINISAGSAPPLTPSPGPPSHSFTVISNGYSSPMSSGSYDPYSPNGKLGMSDSYYDSLSL